MSELVFGELERNLNQLERSVTRPGSPRLAGRELGRYLNYLHGSVIRQVRLDPSMHNALHRLIRRAHDTRSAQGVKDLVRDIRQFQMSLSSLSYARDVEARLSDLETQLKTSAEGAADDEPLPEAEAVTLEGLKGKRILFAIMPFAPEFEDAWVGGIKRAASGTGLTPIRIDMLTQSSEITEDIVQAIKKSEVVVVDVTGNNPNVMFEFGFALALKKKQVVISQSTDYLTFDIKNLRTLIYRNTWQGIETLHKDLQPFIKGALGKGKKAKKKGKRRVKAEMQVAETRVA